MQINRIAAYCGPISGLKKYLEELITVNKEKGQENDNKLKAAQGL